MVTESTNLPWVEKYRPKTLQDLVSHQDIITTLTKLIEENRLPHLLFYGPPGTGKTTTILAIARLLFTPTEVRSRVLELNASDDRGIGVVRDEILSFASTKGLSFGTQSSGLKLVILDEADAMTKDAQNALRRVIEKYTATVRFCLIGNYLSKIIPALQSRCTRFRFPPLSTRLMLPRLKAVAEAEGVKVTEGGEKALLHLSEGDMRRVINVLQAAAMAFDEVTEEAVYACVGHPQRADIRAITDALLNLNTKDAAEKINAVRLDKGLALADILTEVHLFLHRLELPVSVKTFLVSELGELEARLANGAGEKLQLYALVAAFQLGREMLEAEAPSEDEDSLANMDLDLDGL